MTQVLGFFAGFAMVIASSIDLSMWANYHNISSDDDHSEQIIVIKNLLILACDVAILVGGITLMIAFG